MNFLSRVRPNENQKAPLSPYSEFSALHKKCARNIQRPCEPPIVAHAESAKKCCDRAEREYARGRGEEGEKRGEDKQKLGKGSVGRTRRREGDNSRKRGRTIGRCLGRRRWREKSRETGCSCADTLRHSGGGPKREGERQRERKKKRVKMLAASVFSCSDENKESR